MAHPVPTDDYYAILEVDDGVDMAAIKASYKRLAKLRHPDRNIGDTSATANFQRLQAAYSTLSDPTKRQAYDRRLVQGVQGVQGPKKETTNTWRPGNAKMASKEEWWKEYAERVRKRREKIAGEIAEEKKREAAAEARRREYREEWDRQQEEWRKLGEKWKESEERWEKLAEERRAEEARKRREEEDDYIL